MNNILDSCGTRNSEVSCASIASYNDTSDCCKGQMLSCLMAKHLGKLDVLDYAEAEVDLDSVF